MSRGDHGSWKHPQTACNNSICWAERKEGTPNRKLTHHRRVAKFDEVKMVSSSAERNPDHSERFSSRLRAKFPHLKASPSPKEIHIATLANAVDFSGWRKISYGCQGALSQGPIGANSERPMRMVQTWTIHRTARTPFGDKAYKVSIFRCSLHFP